MCVCIYICVYIYAYIYMRICIYEYTYMRSKRLVTQFVTTGACGFGHCFDIKTRDKPVTITKLFSASSPGLNWGQVCVYI